MRDILVREGLPTELAYVWQTAGEIRTSDSGQYVNPPSE